MALVFVNSVEELKGYIDKPGSKVILMASTTFCVPCKKVTPIFEDVSEDVPGSFYALKVNLDESPAVNEFLGVGSVPTFIYWRDGEEVYRTIGANTKKEFTENIKKFFG